MKMHDIGLEKLDAATRMLAEVKTMPEAMKLISMAEAARVYAKQAKLGLEAQNHAAEIKIRAERKAGEMLAGMEKNRGGQAEHESYRSQPVTTSPQKLDDLGIGRMDSHRWQQVASMPEDTFEKHIEEHKTDGKELTTGAVIRKAKDLTSQTRREETRQAAAKDVELNDRIIVGDFRDHADQVPDNSLSLIFTDPPYDRGAEKLFVGLADFAAKKLAPGGSILLYAGHLQIPAIVRAFDGQLRHWWTCACVHSGSQALMTEYGIRVGWKPIFWYVKETRHDKSNIVQDTISGTREKSHHAWQQALSEAEYWIQELCPADGIVCDPFIGGGTTAVAAQNLGRKWIGFEIDATTAAIASDRLIKL